VGEERRGCCEVERLPRLIQREYKIPRIANTDSGGFCIALDASRLA
jgi:hypothetical protein